MEGCVIILDVQMNEKGLSKKSDSPLLFLHKKYYLTVAKNIAMVKIVFKELTYSLLGYISLGVERRL